MLQHLGHWMYRKSRKSRHSYLPACAGEKTQVLQHLDHGRSTREGRRRDRNPISFKRSCLALFVHNALGGVNLSSRDTARDREPAMPLMGLSRHI